MTINRDLLFKMLGRLGSDHDGEVLNAARMANKAVKDSGETWESVVLRGEGLNGAATAHRFTEDDLRYAYVRGKGEGDTEGYARAKTEGGSSAITFHSTHAFHSVERPGQEWREWTKAALANGRYMLRPIEIEVFEKFLAGGYNKPTPRMIETFWNSVANKLDQELPE